MIYSVYPPMLMLQNYGRHSKYCEHFKINCFSNYRSKSLHPDKSSTTNGAFLVVRHAYQTLLHPLKRKVYDLFGPISAQWDLHSEREYLLRGVAWGVLPGYVISFIALQIWGLFGRGGQVKYVFPLRNPK